MVDALIAGGAAVLPVALTAGGAAALDTPWLSVGKDGRGTLSVAPLTDQLTAGATDRATGA